MGLVYGIDFGTSNSAIMVGLPGGRIRRVRNPVESIYDIPSVVCLRSDDTLVVGSVAWRMRLQRPAWYRDEFKRDIGRSVPFIFPPENPGDIRGSRSFEINFLVAQVLRLLREQAEHEVPGDVDLVVITVPASWQASNRGQMLQAAAIAGLEPSRVRLVTEPEAAVAYAVQEHIGDQEKTLLVYDLGGGTFDCAVVRGSKLTGFEVLGEAGGLDDVGGVIFNREILRLVRSRFPQEMDRLFTRQNDDIQVLQRRLQIRDTCEYVKRYLSTELHFEGMLPELAPDAHFSLTRTELAELISPMLTETIAECERLLRSLDMDWSGIDMVVPVGGSSRLPIVGEMIARRSGKQHASVMRVEDPELAVVHGAALHALAFANMSARGNNGHARQRAVITDQPLPERSSAAPGDSEDMARPLTHAQPQPAAVPVFAPSLAPEMSDARLETAPPRADSVAPPSYGRRERPVPTAKFPPAGISFQARQTKTIAQLRRYHRSTATVICLAAVLAIVNFFDVPGSAKPGHGITQSDLTNAAYGLTALGVVGFAVTSAALNRALKSWGGMLTAGIATACAAVAHYFVHGWDGWVFVALLLLVAPVAWAGGSESIPEKMKFVRSAKVSPSGLVLDFDDGQSFTFRWNEIESIIEQPATVTAVIVPNRFHASYGGNRLKYNTEKHTVDLFARYHFTPERDVLAAIDFYSGKTLTQEAIDPAG